MDFRIEEESIDVLPKYGQVQGHRSSMAEGLRGTLRCT